MGVLGEKLIEETKYIYLYLTLEPKKKINVKILDFRHLLIKDYFSPNYLVGYPKNQTIHQPKYLRASRWVFK